MSRISNEESSLDSSLDTALTLFHDLVIVAQNRHQADQGAKSLFQRVNFLRRYPGAAIETHRAVSCETRNFNESEDLLDAAKMIRWCGISAAAKTDFKVWRERSRINSLVGENA
jgi:hypothetical protein